VYVGVNLVLAHVWATAPALSKFEMSSPQPLPHGPRRRSEVLDSADGHVASELVRPASNRRIGWTSQDRLLWWRRTPAGYAVLSTDRVGASRRLILRVRSNTPNLLATWRSNET
jgi:hypothetical protein